MNTFNKIKKTVFDIYYGIGVVSLGLMATLVIFSVIMRYFFSLNWKELSEFNVVLFAFTTFWGMGICILKEEHVMIDIFFDKWSVKVKRIFSIVNYSIVLIVLLVFTYYSFGYVAIAGKQLSLGMEIPMKYMYGIMPVCGIIGSICTGFKIAEFATAPAEKFASKNKVLTKEEEVK